MRFFLLALLSLFVASCVSKRPQIVNAVEIKDILPRYMEEWQFMRISEYVTEKEKQGNRSILRSDSSARSGYYFILILDKKLKRLPPGTVFEGEFFIPKSPDVQKHAFMLPNKPPGTKEIFLGLTGDDWPYGKDRVPSAWRFTIKDGNGKVLGSKKSYLWSL